MPAVEPAAGVIRIALINADSEQAQSYKNPGNAGVFYC
jgi:hypothetical protein